MVMPGLDHADRRGVDGQVGRAQRGRELRIVERDGGDRPRTDAREAAGELGCGCGGPVADRDPPRAGVEAGEDDGVRGPAGPGHDHVAAGERPAHRQLDASAEAGRVGVEADQPAGVGPLDVVDRADRRPRRARPRRTGRRPAACTAP